MWGKGILIYRWWECRLLQPMWKTVPSFIKKLKMELSLDSLIPLLGIYLKKSKTPIRKKVVLWKSTGERDLKKGMVTSSAKGCRGQVK